MKAVFLRFGVLLIGLTLAGCETTRTSPVEVTRFHLGQPIAQGQIAIEAFDPAEESSIEFKTYAAAVARQLNRLGWTVVDSVGRSEQVALLGVRHGSREAISPRGPVSVGVGGSTGGWGSGVGMGVGLNLGGRPKPTVSTLLEVRIKRRSDGTVFWEGRAGGETRSAPDAINRAAEVDRLAEALFRDFPGPSGQTVRIR